MIRLDRLALICGLVPLSVGTMVFIAWLITRDSDLMAIGAATIAYSIPLFIIGFISLIVDGWKASEARNEEWRARRLVARSILLLNFPVAATYVAVACYLNSTYTIIVENISAERIDRLTLVDPFRNRYEFGPVEANDRREEAFHFRGEGSVLYEVSSGGVVRSDVLIGYTTFGIGGCVRLTIEANGASSGDECL